MEITFANRTEAGRLLAWQLQFYAERRDVLILALPRGGVPVAYEVAAALDVELEVLVVRKLGVPYYPETAMGAIASGGALYVDPNILRFADVSPAEFDAVLAHERAELERREALYRGSRAPLEIQGKSLIVVDDGVATGATLRAALAALRPGRPAQVIVAVPVVPADTSEHLQAIADAVVSVITSNRFRSVSEFYDDFRQTTDDEVRDLLQRAWQRGGSTD